MNEFLTIFGYFLMCVFTLYVTVAACAVVFGEAIFGGISKLSIVFIGFACILWAFTIWAFPFDVSISIGGMK